MQSGRVRNAAITSSSRWDNKHAPHLARLHNVRRGAYMGGWTARTNNAYQWLQIDLGKSHKVVRVSTQGRPTANQWVTSYYLLSSQDGVYFASYFERNTRKVGAFIEVYLLRVWIELLLNDLPVANHCQRYFSVLQPTLLHLFMEIMRSWWRGEGRVESCRVS